MTFTYPSHTTKGCVPLSSDVTMIATNYLEWDGEFVSNALTDCYTGLLHRFKTKALDVIS